MYSETLLSPAVAATLRGILDAIREEPDDPLIWSALADWSLDHWSLADLPRLAGRKK